MSTDDVYGGMDASRRRPAYQFVEDRDRYGTCGCNLEKDPKGTCPRGLLGSPCDEALVMLRLEILYIASVLRAGATRYRSLHHYFGDRAP